MPVIFILLLITPVAYGVIRAGGYALADPFDHFGLAISNLLPIVFPLLTTSIFAIAFGEEVRSGYCLLEQIRIGRPRYVLRRSAVAALIGAGAAFATIATWWLITMTLAPQLGWVNYTPDVGVGSPAIRFTWSQFMANSSVTFFVIYAIMVAIHGALYSVMGVLLTIALNNRLLALTAPFIGAFTLNFVFGSLGIGQWGPLAAVFTQGMTQGSILPGTTTTLLMIALVITLAIRCMSTSRPAVNFQ